MRSNPEYTLLAIWVHRIHTPGNANGHLQQLIVPAVVTHSDSFIRVTRHIHVCDTTRPLRLQLWLIQIHLYVWHDTFMCVTRLIHMRDANLRTRFARSVYSNCCALPCPCTYFTYIYVYIYIRCALQKKKNGTWLVQKCDVIHSEIRRDSSHRECNRVPAHFLVPAFVWHSSQRSWRGKRRCL